MEYASLFRTTDFFTTDTRLIDGYPAFVEYSPPGPRYDKFFPGNVLIFDPATGIQYSVTAFDRDMRKNVDAVIAVARSLLPE